MGTSCRAFGFAGLEKIQLRSRELAAAPSPIADVPAIAIPIWQRVHRAMTRFHQSWYRVLFRGSTDFHTSDGVFRVPPGGPNLGVPSPNVSHSIAFG